MSRRKGQIDATRSPSWLSRVDDNFEANHDHDTMTSDSQDIEGATTAMSPILFVEL